MNITGILLIICIGFNLFTLIFLLWYVKRRTKSMRLLDEERNELNGIIVDINAVTDRNLLLVEDSIRQLKEILEETQKRIKVYSQELERSKSGEALYTSLGRGIRAALNTPNDTIEISGCAPAAAPVYSAHIASPAAPTEAHTAAHTAAQIPRQQMPQAMETALFENFQAAEPKPIRSAAAGTRTKGEKPPSKRQIRALIDQHLNEGLSPEEIASNLGISLAEVNLAVNLRKARG